MKKTEFSKRLFIFIAVLNVLLLIFSCIITWRTGDTAILVVAIAGTAADQAFAIKYYYRKAEQENIIKLKKAHGLPVTEDDIESGGDAYD